MLDRAFNSGVGTEQKDSNHSMPIPYQTVQTGSSSISDARSTRAQPHLHRMFASTEFSRSIVPIQYSVHVYTFPNPNRIKQPLSTHTSYPTPFLFFPSAQPRCPGPGSRRFFPPPSIWWRAGLAARPRSRALGVQNAAFRTCSRRALGVRTYMHACEHIHIRPVSGAVDVGLMCSTWRREVHWAARNAGGRRQ